MTEQRHTAVTFLMKEISDILSKFKIDGIETLLLSDAYMRALSSEQKQIEDAYDWGRDDEYQFYINNEDSSILTSTHYYNSNYKTKI